MYTPFLIGFNMAFLHISGTEPSSVILSQMACGGFNSFGLEKSLHILLS